MILHIIDDEKFLVSAIDLFENLYPKENVFLVGVDSVSFNDHEKLEERTQIHFKKINTRAYKSHYLSLSKLADLVVYHNVYKTYKLRLLKRYNTKAKTAWFFWGAELYGLNPSYNPLLPLTERAYLKSLPLKIYLKKVSLSILKKHYYWTIFKRALKENKLKYTLTNITEDIDLLETYTNYKTKRGWFTYYSYNENIRRDNNIPKDHILIGNSSSETNNHLDAFHLLKDKNLSGKKIYIPLNYGDKNYKDLVVKQAEVFFKEQARPITDFLSLENYTAIIASCAILIMNHKRQQAFNTIMIALANGCKVFLREENTIFKMLKREGFKVFSIQDDIESNVALNALTIEEQNHNLKLIKRNYSKNKVLKRVKSEFEQMLNESD